MKSKLIILLIMLIFLFSIVSVSATDDINDTILNNDERLSLENDEAIYANDTHLISDDENESFLSESDIPALKESDSSHYGYWVWSLYLKTQVFHSTSMK